MASQNIRGVTVDEEARQRGAIIAFLLCQGQVNADASGMLPKADSLEIFRKGT